MTEQQFFARRASGLVRQISMSDAMMFNVLLMGVNWTFVYIVFDAVLYPGVNVPLTQIIAAPLVMIVALTFSLLAVSMPRAGGDYIWCSRILSPYVGFIESFTMILVVGGWTGTLGAIGFQPGLSELLIDWGTLTNNSAMVTSATSIVTPMNVFLIMLLLTALTMVVNVGGTKLVFRFCWVLFAFSLFGVLLFCGVMLAAGHTAFVARFNQLSGANYDQIIQTAQSAGYNTGLNISGTLLGMVYAFVIYFGFAWSSYFAGEMKDTYRSQLVAIVGGVLFFMVVTWLPYQVTYMVAGQPFIHAASYLWGTGNAAWTLPSAPYLHYLIIFATSNPWIASIVVLSLLALGVSSLTQYWYMSSRILFAQSFDRILPTAISTVDSRFHAPRYALAFMFILAIPFIYLGTFTTFLSYTAYTNVIVWIIVTIIGLAAAAFPYRRKDIFDKAPGLARKKIGSIPLITILGVATMVIAMSVSISQSLPQFTGAPLNPYYVSGALATFVPAIVYYPIVAWYNKRRGLDMGTAFHEIPPL
ncbi:MAG: APC family permease [Candidatus Bathyarchaeia archaeon]